MAVLLVAVVGPFVYINFIKDDPPDRADASTTSPRRTTDRRRHDLDHRRRRPTASRAPGRWPTAAIVGYRIEEVLFGQDAEAVGRTERRHRRRHDRGHHGHRRPSFEVDMTTFESGESPARRPVRGPHHGGEPSSRPPTFVLTVADRAGRRARPTARRSPSTATGDLTLHGVTREVTIDLVARLDGGTFAVNGTTTDRRSPTTTSTTRAAARPRSGDNGELEVLLVFSR